MNKAIKSPWSFIKLLIKRWVLLLIFYGSLIGAFFTFGIFNIEVPSYVFWILALIGLFWASYRVYRNLSIDYLELQKSSGVLLEVKPELSITLLEGNEYKYSLSKRASSREKVGYDYLTPDASIELHFRILNKGTVDLDIISIEASYEDYGIPWQFHPPDKPKEKGNELCFPMHLSVDDILLCDINNDIGVSLIFNDAQFAARLLKINKNSTCARGEVIVEARDSTGEIHEFPLLFDAALKPLMDLYINKWQEIKQTNLLRLARSETKIKKSRKSKSKAAQKNKPSSM